MANGFIKFLHFIEKATGRYPEELADSFQDIFIFIPNDKTPPKIDNSFTSQRTISMQKYFSTRNEEFSKLVYNDEWNHLEIYLGSELLRFCISECIFAKQTKAGGFLISNMLNLSQKIPNQDQSRLNRIFYNTATFSSENESTSFSKKNESRIVNEPTKSLDRLFHPSATEIFTDNMLFRISRTRKFPNDHVLVKKTETPLSSYIIDTQVGNHQIIDSKNCIEPLEIMMKKLRKSHNRYNYEKALDRLITAEATNAPKKPEENQNLCKQLSLSVLKMFFTNICRAVFPEEMFATHRNRNIIVKMICDLLETPRHQSFNLKSYILKIRITDMHWLDGVKDAASQCSILGKLVIWIVKNFILEIFRVQFYVMVRNTNEKIYFKQKDWHKLNSEFLRQMSKDKVIAKTNGLHTKKSRDGKWMFVPKKNGMRPIMSRVRNKSTTQVTKDALCYLQQLYVTNYGSSEIEVFREKWRDLVDKSRKAKNKTIYLVCCDIQNAYGSIIQKKLMDIVKSLANETGPELGFKYYKVARNLGKVKSGCWVRKKYFMYPELELFIAPKSIFTCEFDQVTKASRAKLLQEIRLNVENLNVFISNRRYLLQKGIAQGAMLSSVLCDIYYAHMEEAELSDFKDKGLLYRYVDDILFATEDRVSAERFLEHVKKGFIAYDCKFNVAKTKTNLPGNEHTAKNIGFLGFNIDPQTLEVTLQYSKKTRYVTLLSKPRRRDEKTILETFRRRLSNLATLRLDGLILDCKVNSEDTIVHNIKRVFERQAERCLWLLKALFDDVPSQLSEILKIIKSTNLQIIRHIQRYFLASGYNFEKLVPRLVVIPWKCYRQVFGRMPEVHSHFRSLFLKNIKLSEHEAARYGFSRQLECIES